MQQIISATLNNCNSATRIYELSRTLNNSTVQKIDDIYRARLKLLAAEAGSQKALAERLNKSPAQISQWINGSKDSRTGKPRSVDRETVRQIERDFPKPDGWMDQPTTASPLMAVLVSRGEIVDEEGPHDPSVVHTDDHRGPYKIRADGRKLFLEEEVGGPSNDEIGRWRMSLADDEIAPIGSVDMVWASNDSGKSGLLRAITQFADLARSGVEAPQRKLLAQMVGSMFEDGPSENTARAIDALTPQLDEAAEQAAPPVLSAATYRSMAMEVAKSVKDSARREEFLNFLNFVDQQMAAVSQRRGSGH